MKLQRIIVSGLISFLLAMAVMFLIKSASGSDCYIAQRQVVSYAYVQPIYVAPLVYYSAGQSIIAEANVEKIAQRVYQLQQQQQQLKSAAVQAPINPQPVRERFSVLAAKCAKCHSGTNPKAGLIIDGKTEMLCHQITQSIRAIRDDHMPLDRPLSAAEKPVALEELLALESRLPPSDAPAPAREQGNDLPPPVEPLRPRQDGNLQ